LVCNDQSDKQSTEDMAGNFTVMFDITLFLQLACLNRLSMDSK